MVTYPLPYLPDSNCSVVEMVLRVAKFEAGMRLRVHAPFPIMFYLKYFTPDSNIFWSFSPYMFFNTLFPILSE